MTLLQMSLSGGVLILVITLLRALLLDRLPRRTFPVLWAVAAARLLIPLSLPSPTSIYSLLQRSQTVQEGIYTMQEANLLPVSPAVADTAGAAARTAPDPATTAAAAASGPVIPVQTLLWLAGVLLVFVVFAVAYVRSYLQFRESVPVQTPFIDRWLLSHPLRRSISIRQLDRISAPLTYGIFRPVILLPKNTDWENELQLSYVLEHEFVHICRFDGLFKLVLAAAVCIHWCNPFVWVMLILANRDIELSCDAAVLRRMAGENRRAYALTLLSLEAHKSGLPALYSSFSKNAIEERVRSIMKHKKSTVLISLAAVALVACVIVFFATSAAYKTVYADVEAEAEALTGGTSGISDAFAGQSLSEEEPLFDTDEQFFFHTLDDGRSLDIPFPLLLEDDCYWVLLVQNTGEAPIAVDAGGTEEDSTYFVQPGETQAIYSNGPWISRNCTFGFSSSKRMQGYLDCYRSNTPLLPEQSGTDTDILSEEIPLNTDTIILSEEPVYAYSDDHIFSLKTRDSLTPPLEISLAVETDFKCEISWASNAKEAEILLCNTDTEKTWTQTLQSVPRQVYWKKIPAGHYTLQVRNPTTVSISGSISFAWQPHLDNSTLALLDLEDVPYDTDAIEERKAEIQNCIDSNLFVEGSENGSLAQSTLDWLDQRLENIQLKEEYDADYGPYGITFDPESTNFYYQGQVVTLLSDVGYTASTNYGSVTVIIERENGIAGEISDIKIYTGTTYRMEERDAYFTINEDTNEFLLNLNGNGFVDGPLITGTVSYGQDGTITATAEDGRIVCFQIEDDKTLSFQRKDSSVQTYTYQGTTQSFEDGTRFLLDETPPA